MGGFLTLGGEKPRDLAEYLATLNDDQQRVLGRLREVILAAAPGAEEGFSYSMPACRLGGKSLIWYAAWKHHYSLYPLTEAMGSALPAGGEGFEISGKGTIRFPAGRPLPYDLISKVVAVRVAELGQKRG